MSNSLASAKSSSKTKHSKAAWYVNLLSSVLIIAFIKWCSFDIYTIPTPSMEGSLLVGDFLIVSKLSYGPRTPKTLLQIPLTNGVVWRTSIPSYLDWIQVPMYRFPGFQRVKRGDIVVFNYPMKTDMPIDVRPYYVKRCVGVGGDTIAIHDTQVWVNGKPTPMPKWVQFRYFVQSQKRLPMRVFEQVGIWDVSATPQGYLINARPKQAQALAKKAFITRVEKIYLDPANISRYVFPKNAHSAWTPDHYGPLLIPYANMRISLNDSTWALYGETIKRHEGHRKVFFNGHGLKIDHAPPIKEYVFKRNYYFMMGDNRHNSEDSRYWGFVPDNHIVGKPVRVALSFDKQANWLSKLRWRRTGRAIH